MAASDSANMLKSVLHLAAPCTASIQGWRQRQHVRKVASASFILFLYVVSLSLSLFCAIYRQLSFVRLFVGVRAGDNWSRPTADLPMYNCFISSAWVINRPPMRRWRRKRCWSVRQSCWYGTLFSVCVYTSFARLTSMSVRSLLDRILSMLARFTSIHDVRRQGICGVASKKTRGANGGHGQQNRWKLSPPSDYPVPLIQGGEPKQTTTCSHFVPVGGRRSLISFACCRLGDWLGLHSFEQRGRCYYPEHPCCTA